MIKLSGFELDKDMEIKITGLRPGEKLYEELLTASENSLPTHHSKIMRAKVEPYPFDQVSTQVDELITLFNSQDNQRIVGKLKEIVPEYVSANSAFSELDKQKS